MHRNSYICLLLSLAILSCQTPLALTEKKSVGVYIKGSHIDTPENISTRRLRDSIEALVANHNSLRLAYAGDEDLTVLIPSLVTISRDLGIERVAFSAKLTRKSDDVSKTITGSCKREQLDGCARKIVDALLKSSEFKP